MKGVLSAVPNQEIIVPNSGASSKLALDADFVSVMVLRDDLDIVKYFSYRVVWKAASLRKAFIVRIFGPCAATCLRQSRKFTGYQQTEATCSFTNQIYRHVGYIHCQKARRGCRNDCGPR